MCAAALSSALGRAAAGQLDRRRLDALDGAEHDLGRVAFALNVDDDGLPGVELLPQDLLGECVLDVALDGPAQRPGTQLRVVALLGQVQLRLRGELQAEALALQLPLHPLD